MGESAVLVHSYSFAAPLSRNDSHEDHANYALSQSVSFGKFMTENLEWGKWSTFSHKKYVEEAEKYSRPGSVAQKKAFFEAHYKRIAEAKKAATEEQPSVTPAQVLLHALETNPPPPPPPLLLLQEDDHEDGDDDGDDLTEEKKQRRSVTKNKPVFRLSLEKTIPPKSTDPEIAAPDKICEKPITQDSEEKEVKQIVHHRQRFSLLSCFTGTAKAQDQNQSSRKKKKQFLCLCLKPKTVRES